MFRVIVISPPDRLKSEIAIVHELLDNGLEVFHLRKPEWSEKQHRVYLKKIKPEYLDRVVVHHYSEATKVFTLRGVHYRFSAFPYPMYAFGNKVSCSVHSWPEFKQIEKQVVYAFISPFFNSISKKGYQANQALWTIPPDIIRRKAIALGGINATNIAKIRALDLGGAAVSGTIWQSSDPVGAFIKLKNIGNG